MPAVGTQPTLPAAVEAAQHRHRPKKKRRPPAGSSLVSILGSQGATAAHHEANQLNRAVRRQRRQRHAAQRAELRHLALNVIPTLQRQRTALSTVDPFNYGGLTGPTSDALRSQHLAEVQTRLAAAQARANHLRGLIQTRRGRRAEGESALNVALDLASAIPPLRAGEGVGLLARALGIGGEAEKAAPAIVKGAAAVASKGAVAARTADEATSARNLLRLLRGGEQAVTSAGKAEKAVQTASGARRTLRAAGAVGKGTVKASTFPLRHPLKYGKLALLAQTPVAIQHHDLGELGKVFTGGDVLGGALSGIGTALADASPVEIAGNIAKDALDLPANAIPAIYMPLAGLVEAAQGDPSRLDSLWQQYKDTGIIPAIVSGNPDEVLARIKEHPLFGALELRGAQAAVGRGVGAALRSGVAGERGQEIASIARKPLRLPGDLAPHERRYSHDVIEKAAQVLRDRRRKSKTGGQKATPREVEKILRERVDRIVAAEEGARRAGRSQEAEGAVAAMPERKVDQEGVSLAVQGIIRSPRTFEYDLASFKAKLERVHARMERRKRKASGRDAASLKVRLKQNEAMQALIDRVLRDGDPEAIFASSRENVSALRATDEALVERGLLDPRQAQQARLIPFARAHLGARYRKQMVDREGNPLPPERIEELRRQLGAEETGFVSQSPSARGPGSFYRAFGTNRQTLPKARRTGKATTQGTFDASYEALAEQRIRGRGIVDAVRGFDSTVRELAASSKRFKNFAEAREAARHPRQYGLPQNVELVPVRLGALGSRKSEIARAEEIFDHLDPANQQALEATSDKLLNEALRDGDGPVVLLPKQAVDRLREHFQAATTTRRAFQVISAGFKGVVLPLNPRWFLGNFVDMSMRLALRGTGAYGLNARLGRRLMREVDELDPEAAKRVRAALVPGTLFGAADATRVFRDARQFAGTGLAPMARAMGALRRTPGVRQVVNLYVRYRNAAFQFNEKFIERQAQYAMLGKEARRELQATTQRWHSTLRLGDDAVRDLAKGLLKTPKQIQYAKGIERTLGQWTANSPGTRAFLVDYMPFGMWSRAAIRFVWMTVPHDHPVFAGLAAIAYEMTEDERDALGLSLFAPKGQRLPESVQGSIPLGGGGILPVSSLSSFGYFNDLPKNLASSILPQVDLDALQGLDWTGEKLKHADGTPLNVLERIGAALQGTAEAYIPFVAQGQRISEKGVGYTLNPLRPYDPGLTEYLRSLSASQQITVPVEGSASSSGGNPWQTTSGGSNPWSTGASTSNPWKN